MALQIKGLKGKALLANQHIDSLNKAYDKFNEAAPKLTADVNSLADQVSVHQSDLEFAATVLGNSTERSDDTEGDSLQDSAEKHG